MGYILEYIIDTRSYDYDTCKPIPSTGDARECDFCGKTHEIHCHVHDAKTGDKKICGTTCLKKHAYDKDNLLKRHAGPAVHMYYGKNEFSREVWFFLFTYIDGTIQVKDTISGTEDEAKVEFIKRWKVVRWGNY